jgi:hypothetical protein
MNHPASTATAFDLLAALKRRYRLVGMDILKMLAELRAEKARLDDFIAAAERYAAGSGRRRGRPPAWMTELKRRGRPPGSKNKAKSPAA